MALTPDTLKGHAALVTGGSRGIGRGIATALAAAGADVAVVCTRAAGAAEVKAEIEALGRRCVVLEGDIGELPVIERLCKEALEEFPELDILVNNAGITRDKLLWRMDASDWDDVLRVNLTAPFHFTRLLTRAMAKRRFGRVIQVSSVVGEMGNVGQANYCAAKAGLLGLTRAVAREFAARGVTCNAIAPGYIETDMTAAMPDAARDAMRGLIPSARFGLAGDVGAVVAFLASPEASYVNGQVLRVDGGMLMG